MKNKINEYVGKKGFIKVGDLKVEVNIIDVKNSYGNDRYLVSPVAGEGEVWVQKIIISK